MKKRLISSLLALIMVLSLVPVSAFAENEIDLELSTEGYPDISGQEVIGKEVQFGIEESQTPDADIDNGQLILINDGTKIKIARGVNSLTTTSDAKSDDFKKIKIIEAVDMIRDDIRTTFEDDFVGKVENSYDNKIVFLAAVNKYFRDLASQGVLYDQFDNKAEIDIEGNREWLSLHKDVSTWDDEKIKTANTGTNVFVKANIQVQDAIEDLNFNVYME